MMTSTVPSFAGLIDRLLLPGPLIEDHAKYEDKCSNCHDLFDKGAQNQKCQKCHEWVQKDIAGKTGFHGRRKGLEKLECRQCHTDHQGRRADVVLLDPDTFDHKITDFPLKGKHNFLKCSRCHAPDQKHREAKAGCYACHKKDDPHQTRLGKECSKCHQESGWKKTKFNHGKATKFVLKGKHAKLKCEGCHLNQRYKKTSMKCISCHAIDDIHHGKLGADCGKCHAEKDWKSLGFNHDKDTKFPLQGKHRTQKCRACHSGNPYKDKLKTACTTCHKNDDYHKGRFGVLCQKCHAPEKWTAIHFDHKEKTKFPLLGKHGRLGCEMCHRQNPFIKKLKRDCIACHQADDVHLGKQGKKCDKCHHPEAWGRGVKFDHDKTKFPLKGIHATTTCENCHVSEVFKGTPVQCAACHARQDVHKKSLGDQCNRCHNPGGWDRWKFDHNKQTKFALTGAHEPVRCHSCHTQPVKKKVNLSMECYGCHKADDVHKGQEGQACQRCHEPGTWGNFIRFNHDLTRFPLIGIHAVAACEDCHLSQRFKDTDASCISCHKADDDHEMRLGPRCALCHNPNGWPLWRFDHNEQTEFSLLGAHQGLQCLGCHKYPVKGDPALEKTCSPCHQADDKHFGRFGKACDRCHGVKSFSEIKLGR